MADTQPKIGLSGYIPLRPSWDLDTKLQQSSKTWLREHGLERQHLTLEQILASTGFRQKKGFVKPLGREVSSRYAGDGFFQQKSPSSGELFNVVNKHELERKEKHLLTAIAKLKARLQWLTSGSRQACGPVTEASAVLLFHATSCPPIQLPILLAVAKGLVEEQFANITSFNIVRCQSDIDVFSDAGMVDSTSVFIQSAVKFLATTSQLGSKLGPVLPTSLQRALQLTSAQAVYVFVYSEVLLKHLEELKNILKSSPIPVHFICFLNSSSQKNNTVNCLKELCAAAHGRYRIISMDKSSISQGIHLEDHVMQEDILVLEEEMEHAKDTLAEVQALLLEMKSKQTSLVSTKHVASRKLTENSLTSNEWLKIHGLNFKKLLFSDLLASLAFRHCEAVFDLPNPSSGNLPSQIPSKLIGARYCRNLIHLRWPDGKTYHVSLSDVTASRYEQQVSDVVRSCEKRLEWLQRGSRKTFGILTAHKVVMVIDTSVSMKGNFQIVKDNLALLFQEQLNTVHHYFTLVQCSSHTFSWREGLVPCTPQNLTAALQWVQSLQTVGSTNIISALKVAIFVPSVEAVYLLTDGNSDQSITQILSELSQWPHVPVHTVSFNHDDSRANKLLAQLAIATGGQFHSHHSTDTSGPSPYKSEDVELIENELALAKEQIEQAKSFQQECKQLRQQPPIDLVDYDKPSEEKKKKKKNKVKTRSSSAKIRRESRGSMKSPSLTSSKISMSSASLQASVTSVVSSPTHNDSKRPVSRPLSASSEHSHCSSNSSMHSSRLANRKTGSKKNQSSERKKKSMKHYKVLAQCNNDGFYYPATVIGDDDSHHKQVKFADGSVQSVSNRHVIPTGGATSRPSLQVGDHVLGRVRSMSGTHMSDSGACDYYVPATVCVLPQQPSASYSLLAYNKRQVRCLRRDVIKITTERYKLTARMIGIKLGTGNVLPTGHKESCDSVTRLTTPEKLPPTPQDTVSMQQLLLEQQKQQTLLLNQQELLVGLQEGHKELMEKVQYKGDADNHSSEREWWIKKLLEQSSMPTVLPKNDALRSQSFPNLGNSSRHHLIGYRETAVISNTAIGIRSQILSKEKHFVSSNVSFKEPSGEETIPESPSLLAPASVAVEASADTSPTHNPTYQSCGTNTHNLVDAGVNTAPLTVDICIGTEWPVSSSSSSSSEDESEDKSKTEGSPQSVKSSDTSPQGKGQHTASITEKELQSEGSDEMPSQPQTTTATTTTTANTSSSSEPSSHPEVINQEVLARSVDGYYYWSVVLQYDHQQDSYVVEDLDSRQQLRMGRSDFITETQDAARLVLQLYDRALAPRVLSPNCFLPGIVMNVSNEGQYTVKLSDNTTSIRLRNEIYYLPIGIYDMNIEAISVAQRQWLEQAVIARDDSSGFYYPGIVVEVTEHEQFRIEWTDGSRCLQAPIHVFGEYTRKLSLCIGDYVIALYNVPPNIVSDDAVVGALPGKIIGEVEKLLAIEFCNGEKFCNVDPLHCFWIHPNYYEHAQQFIIERSQQ